MTLILSSYAIALLKSLPRFEDEPYLFAAAKSKGHSISLGTLGSVIRGMNRAREQLGLARFIDPQQNREVTPPWDAHLFPLLAEACRPAWVEV